MGAFAQKKTLYISDLDGTLLDREGWLSKYTIDIIRRMNDEGKLFTIATARTLQSVNDLIWYLGLRVPVVLAGGAQVYDTVHQRFLYVWPIPQDSLEQALQIAESYNICSFLYTLQDGVVSIYYRQLHQVWDKIYHEQHVEHYHGRMYQTDNLLEVARYSQPLYLVVCGSQDPLCAMQRELEHVQQISCQLYLDIYNNFYFMDIFALSTMKAEGMLRIRELTGADEIVAFGDNFSDLQMLLAADRSYVPKNGIAAAKNIATDVLDYSYADGVAHFLAREFGWE